MAGDWIKMRTVLQTSPKVVRISSALKADRLRTVGGLHAVWCLFDAHSEDGKLAGYTPEVLDELIGWTGFTRAMEQVSWIIINEDSLCLPGFEAHNGQSAKRRAQETDRKREERKLSALNADKKRTREEKRREDIKPPISPKGADSFDQFWQQYPNKVGKGAARKAWNKIKPSQALCGKILESLVVQQETPQWKREQGKYIPHPSTWLNEERWDDEVSLRVVGRGFVA
jgi:hypothetical protein